MHCEKFLSVFLISLFAGFTACSAGSPLAGSNFWTWGGYGVPQHEDSRWRPGDPLVGDPPQEPQDLNSVFAGDESTLAIIRRHYDNLP